MAEEQDGVHYNADGTLTVRHGGRRWTLRSLTTGELKRFDSRWKLVMASQPDTLSLLTEMREAVEVIADPKATKAKKDKAQKDRLALLEKMRGNDQNGLLDEAVSWLADVFNELGTKLPDDVDEWPSWLGTDVSLPPTFVKHWKNAPKVYGTTQPVT